MARNCRGVSGKIQEKSNLKREGGSTGSLGVRGAGSLQGNWSSGGSTSRRSLEAAMAAVPAEEGEVVVGKGSTGCWTAGAVTSLPLWVWMQISVAFVLCLANLFENSVRGENVFL